MRTSAAARTLTSFWVASRTRATRGQGPSSTDSQPAPDGLQPDEKIGLTVAAVLPLSELRSIIAEPFLANLEIETEVVRYEQAWDEYSDPAAAPGILAARIEEISAEETGAWTQRLPRPATPGTNQ